jgi:hypothetical protein
MAAMSKGRFRDSFEARRDRRLASSRSIVGRPLGLESLEVRTLLSVGFAPAVTSPVGMRPQTVETADLNADGKQDIVVLNQGQVPDLTSSVSVLLGNGDGSLRPPVTTNLHPGANAVAVGDVNGDGRLDLAVAHSVDNVVEVLLGHGDGSFQNDHRVIGVGQGPTAVAVGDFDGNGALDLVTANRGSDTVSLLLGHGDGSFRPRIDLAVGSQPRAVAVHDFNGDGRADLVSADFASSAVSVLLGHGDGTFGPARRFAASDGSVGPTSVAVGDVNGDRRADLVLREQNLVGEGFDTRLGVLLGNGDGTFQGPVGGGFQFGLFGLAVGDFNNDGLTDAALGSSQSVPGQLAVSVSNGDGTFLPAQSVPTGGSNPFGVAAGDLNGDGLVDLVAANTFSNTVGVLLNTSPPDAATTGTTLRTSAATAVFGQTVSLTATVNSRAGTPTGTVTFKDGTTVLGTAQLDAAGRATLAVSPGVGLHVLTASFAGTGGFEDSTSAAEAVTVNRASTTVALRSSANPAVTGQAVTFTARVGVVAPGAGMPTGTVTFFVGDTAVARVALDANGRASLTRVFSRAGRFTIRAVYSGDANFAASEQSLIERVNR